MRYLVPYHIIPPVVLRVSRTWHVVDSSWRLFRLFESRRPVTFLATSGRFLGPSGLGALNCYLRHDSRLYRWREASGGGVYFQTKYGWRAFQDWQAWGWESGCPLEASWLLGEACHAGKKFVCRYAA